MGRVGRPSHTSLQVTNPALRQLLPRTGEFLSRFARGDQSSCPPDIFRITRFLRLSDALDATQVEAVCSDS